MRAYVLWVQLDDDVDRSQLLVDGAATVLEGLGYTEEQYEVGAEPIRLAEPRPRRGGTIRP